MPTAPIPCSVPHELHCALPLGSAAVCRRSSTAHCPLCRTYCRSSIAHCPKAMRH